MSKRVALPNKKQCVSCGACVLQCPRGAIGIYRGCHAVVNAVLCIGCGLCKKACPANAIELIERNTEEING